MAQTKAAESETGVVSSYIVDSAEGPCQLLTSPRPSGWNVQLLSVFIYQYVVAYCLASGSLLSVYLQLLRKVMLILNNYFYMQQHKTIML